MELSLVPGEDSSLTVQYDSTYCLDKHTRIEERHLTVAYKEHPQRDHVVLKSEVYFPNLQFETTEVLRISTKFTNCILWEPTRVNYFDFISTSLYFHCTIPLHVLLPLCTLQISFLSSSICQ